MTLFDDQLAETSRVRQEMAVLGVRYCENFYATPIQQLLGFTEDFTNAAWLKSAGGSVAADPGGNVAPDGAGVWQQLSFAGAADYVEQRSGDGPITTNPYTGSVWLMAGTAGPGNIALKLYEVSGGTGVTLIVAVTTTPTRFDLSYLFGSGVNTTWRIGATGGGIGNVLAWGANLYRNPASTVAGRILFPYRKRTAESASQASVMTSRCQAADAGDGKRCYYSFPTCQDPANFNSGNHYEPGLNGIREYKFCRQDSALPLPGVEVWPLIEKIDYVPQAIDPVRAVTTNESTNVVLLDMPGPEVWDPKKQSQGALVNTASEGGRFWPRFVAIFKNYANPDGYLIVKVGFVVAGFTEALYAQRRKMIVINVTIGADNRATLTCSDRMRLLRASAPQPTSDTDILVAAMNNSQTYMDVPDATVYTEPALNAASATPDYVVTVKVDSEEMNVTGFDPLIANRLLIQRGRWGTAAATHAQGAKIVEVWECGTERSNPSLTPLGKNPIDFVIEALRRAGIAAVDIDIATLQSERDTWMRSAVDPVLGTQTGVLFRRTVTNVDKIETYLQEIRDITLLFLWVGEDQRVTGRLFAPARPTETLISLTEDANFVADTVEVDDQDQYRITEVLVAWSLIPGQQGTKPEDFNFNRTHVAADEESVGFYNEIIIGQQPDAVGGGKLPGLILSQWLPDISGPIVDSTSTHLLDRFRRGARIVKGRVELKDDGVALGSFPNVTTHKIQKPDGSDDGPRIMQVIKKTPQDDGNIELEMMDTGIQGRYGFFAPSATPVYDSQTSAQKRYASFSTKVSPTRGIVGAQADEGYKFW